MSASNFYQTFYQTEQLFRLADEPWGIIDTTTAEPDLSETSEPVLTPVAVAARDDADFLTELERLAAPVEVVSLFGTPVETPDPDTLLTEFAPVMTPAIVAPELLPQPAPPTHGPVYSPPRSAADPTAATES